MASGKSLQKQRVISAWLFLSPVLLILAVTAIWPLSRTIFFSFLGLSEYSLDYSFVGFQNYLSIKEGEFSGVLADKTWWRSVWNTLWFTLVSVSLETILGLLVALMLHQNFKARPLMRAAVLIPWAIPTIVSARMWNWMLNDQFGIINDLMMRLSIIEQPIAWTANPLTAMVAVIVVDVWKTTPFMALLILAGLQILPKDIYENARIDGVHPLRVFWKITLPLIRSTLMIAIIFRALDALRIFDLIYVLTPNNETTMSMSIFAKQEMFDFAKFSYGSAASTLIFLIIAMLVISYIYLGKFNLVSKDED
jgi:trehalose/maltose transport system permease protein